MSALICCLIAMGCLASSAAAANPGGARAGEPGSTPPLAKRPRLHLFPVTTRSRSVSYSGPVFERTPDGEVVPYAPTSTRGMAGTAATATGGSAAAPAATGVPTVIPGELMSASGMTPASGPAQRPELLVPGTRARFVDGLAAAPMSAPAPIQAIVWAGNELIGLPYVYGGGHGSFSSRGYDCSGTVSFALHGASLLSIPEDSSEFEGFGSHGAGRWVTVFANPGHAYMTVAGLRLDTSAADDPSNQQGPRWRPLRVGNSGFVARHPLGL